MKNKKLTRMSVFAILLIGTVGFCIQSNRQTNSQTIDEEEARKAYQLLSDSLSNKSIMYTDLFEEDRVAGQGESSAYAIGSVDMEDYEGLSVALKKNDTACYEVEVTSPGVYYFKVDYKPSNGAFSDYILSMEVNGEQQFSEMNHMVLPLYWKDSTKFFPEDQFGNQTSPELDKISGWRNLFLYDSNYVSARPLGIQLEKGLNTITLQNLSPDSLCLGKLEATADIDVISYEEYKGKHKGSLAEEIYMINSNDYLYKNSLQACYYAINNTALTPHASNKKLINVVSLNTPGTEITYKIITPKDGLYQMAFHYQNNEKEMSVFESIRIDGQVPFEELLNYPFPATSDKWENEVLSDEEGNPYLIYLTKGQHLITLRSEIEPIAKVIRYTGLISEHITQLAADSIKRTNDSKTSEGSINMSEYIPETTDYLKAYETLIRYIQYILGRYADRGNKAKLVTDLNEALNAINKLQNHPGKIAFYKVYLTGKNNSLQKMMENLAKILKEQNFSLDMMYLYGKTNLPKANPSMISTIKNSVLSKLNTAASDQNTGVTDQPVSGTALKEDENTVMAKGYYYEEDKLTYKLVWNDEFEYEGAPDTDKWSYDVGGSGWGNNELQYYTPGDNAWVEDGKLILEARKAEKEEKEYTSARLITKGKGDWLYGRIDVRAKLPKGLGTWPAIWLLSSGQEYGNWPASGEIDIMEHVGYNQDTIHASIHTQAYYHSINTQKTATKYVKGVSEDFHLYSLIWLPDIIKILIDGEVYFTFKPTDYEENPSYREWPFNKKMYLILNLAVGGNWGGAKGIDSSVYPQRMEIDYVRVYQSEEIINLKADMD
ncbi:family 16 glycosylhydrolase [Anaerocolumna sp. AGMB13020]|uniref:family 16 glycosylhydrolase n=1 Tax=Anaerocolumna sp. AGMB13020 TaxID=3081750 RepID=UPI002953A025|nr:family 16 glycosylhydrolase [Anaerocolumna sp. AGMB13020]WOO37467.1 family 16 glycosylhydrolase [Anaerocolumna sp. AGMB13020]